MNPRYLFDENVDPVLARTLRSVYPGIDIVLVGQAGGPAKGAPDAELLRFADQQQRMLVSFDKASLPQHVANHTSAGGQTWGVVLLRQNFPLTSYVQALGLVWQASEAD